MIRMCPRSRGFPAAVFLGWLAAGASLAAPVESATFERDVQPLLKKYCYECHGLGGKDDEGDFHLTDYKSAADVPRDRKLWTQAMEHVRNRQMPPESAEVLPTQPERDLLADWIDRQVYAADAHNLDP